MYIYIYALHTSFIYTHIYIYIYKYIYVHDTWAYIDMYIICLDTQDDLFRTVDPVFKDSAKLSYVLPRDLHFGIFKQLPKFAGSNAGALLRSSSAPSHSYLYIRKCIFQYTSCRTPTIFCHVTP